ncbi:MAG: glycosyltransferase family 2 protein [Bacteroidota bacterium]
MSDIACPDLRFGVVAIGRNEGERLRRCLESVVAQATLVVYVDSGSTDHSLEIARSLNIALVNLDTTIPFTAARARNEGLRRLCELQPDLNYVQFVDGDCEVADGWLSVAVQYLATNPRVAVVCGRRREKFPERSVYNLLCDQEWDTPIGEARACGGDAMMRIAALRRVGGFRPDLIAGEEPELCVRLRADGWRIWRLDHEMTRHDAAMTRFGQWWRRTLRGGYAFAEGAYLHGASAERHWVGEARRARVWGMLLPGSTLLLSLLNPLWLLLLLAYPLQVLRLALQGRGTARENWWRALFLVIGKFPEGLGQINFLRNRLGGRQGSLIEYK